MTLIIKEVLERKGVSIAKLIELLEAKGFSLSRVAISNILNGKSSPKVSTLEEIAEALEMNAVDFFETDEDSTPIYHRNEDGTYTEIGKLNK